MEVSNDNEFGDAFLTLKLLPATMNCRHSFSKPENLQFAFIALYSRMIQRIFFTFIEAPHARNWLQHLSSAKYLMMDVIAKD